MITLIGTGHVFNLSSALLRIFDEKSPDVVCVELDKQRFNALMMKNSDPKGHKAAASKNLPIVYKLLARFQESMADEYGVTAGDEMLTAINYARSQQLPVVFIDMNAQFLFRKMLRSMPLSEKLKLLLSGFGGFFISKKRVEKELSKFEKDFDSYIEQIGEKFPTIKRVLIDERNQYMTQRLSEMDERYGQVVAVVGDGHIPGISELLKSKQVEFEITRLSELRNMENKDENPTSAHFSIKYKSM